MSDLLRNEAVRWLGTPWAPNASVPGPTGGVACHNLPRQILMAVRWLPADFPVVMGTPMDTRDQRRSIIGPWLDARPEFQVIAPTDPAAVQAGDILGFRIRYCVDHLGLALGNAEFVHVLAHKRTTIDNLGDATWSSRLLAIWRIRGR